MTKATNSATNKAASPRRQPGTRSKINQVVFTAPYYGKDNLWEVYPDVWKGNGEAPLLGYVRADTEYWAQYAAYDAGLLPYNASFGPKVVLSRNKINKAGDVRIPSVYQ